VHSNLEGLCLSYYDDIFRYSLSLCHDRELAQDITQDTFLKALKSLHQLKEPAKLKTWLFTISRNLFISKVRQTNKYNAVSTETLLTEIIDTKILSPEQQYLLKESTDYIERIIGKLTEEEQQIFHMKVWEKYSYEEIAEILGMNPNTARVKFHRLRIKLVNFIKEGERYE
jgi:RNA polymerase sigma-70 factor (ECF subfamily)